MTGDLTAFLIALTKTPPERLVNADPDNLAAKYGISPAHAAGYLRFHGWTGSGETNRGYQGRG